jgi:type II secretory pathway pseudopilin PulG
MFLHFKSKGFSLVEMVVSVALFAFIILVVVAFIISLNISNIRSKSDREVQENARRALDAIVYEIKSAKSLYTSTTTASQLSLETYHYLPSGEIATYIDFFLCGTTVCLKKESQSPIALTSDSVQVTSLSFSKVLNGARYSINISITLNSTTGDPAPITLTSSASLRN